MQDQLIEDFKLHFPLIAENAVRYEVNRKFNELTVIFANGRRMLFDGFECSFRNLPDINDLSDRDIKNEFSKRLRRIMYIKHVTQEELSELTDIKQPQISLYINGKATPNFYTADKIARALGCSMDDFRYLEG